MVVDQEPLSQAEITKGKARLSLLQRVMSQAREEVLTHENDFIKAGVLKDLVEGAANIAAERAKSEFEQKTGGDPLCKAARVLRELSRTEGERRVAEKGCSNLETFRFGWQQSINRARGTSEREGQRPSVEEIVKDLEEISCTPSLVDVLTSPKGKKSYYPCLLLVHCDPLVKYQRGEPPLETAFSYLQRVLVGLGALKNGEDISSLKSLPAGKENGEGPLYHHSKIWSGVEFARVATDIDGVSLQVDLTYPRIHMLVDLDALEKIVDFPVS